MELEAQGRSGRHCYRSAALLYLIALALLYSSLAIVYHAYPLDNANGSENFSSPVAGTSQLGLSNEFAEAQVALDRGEDDLMAEEKIKREKRSNSARPILNEFSFPANLVQGMRFVLMCQVLDGEPPIQIKWFKDNIDLSAVLDKQRPHINDDTRLAALDQIEMISNDELGSSLLFRRVKQQHSGNYTCLASNHFGTSAYSSLMTVKDLFASQQQQNSMADLSTTPSTTATLAAGLQPLNFKLINSNHHVQTLENGSLAIRQTGTDHEGLYLCEADNGVEPSLVKQIRLVVHRQAHFIDDIQVLVQSSPSSDHSSGASVPVAQGAPLSAAASAIKSIKLPQNSSLVRLICSPYGDAPLQLDWLKDGRLIHTHSSSGPAAAGSSLSPSSSAAASASSGAIIDHQAPSMAAADDQHRLTHTMGRYHVNTRWIAASQQQKLLSSGAVGTNGLESELLLTNLARHDAGLYTCAARNVFGQSERKLRIIVQEQPEPPTLVDVAHISSRFISLRWLAPFDGNSPITKYVVEYRRMPRSPIAGQDPTHAQSTSSEDLFTAAGGMLVGRSEKVMPNIPNSLKAPAGTLAAFSNNLDQQHQQQQQQAVQLTTGGAQIQHTIHELEPMTRYSMRVLAVNALGASRPSVSLSLRTEEEVPATVPNLVEASVLSSRSIKIRWTISYSLEHELIDGFFIGYRSFDSAASPASASATAPPVDAAKQSLDRPTFTYKTIRLTNQQTYADQELSQASSQVTPLLSPVSSVTKSVPVDALGGEAAPGSKQKQESVAFVISNFEYVIGGLERNTEYTVLIQCFNKKGAGPASDPIVARTLTSDPPEKLALVAEDLSETSLRVSWSFRGETAPPASPFAGSGQSTPQSNPVDGFVLTFAKIAPRHKTPLQATTAQLHSTGPRAADSAARISQPSAAAPSGAAHSMSKGSHSNQHSAPIQTNQLLEQQWQAVQLAPQQRQHVLKNLECGTWYAMKIWAFNSVGKGEPSDLVTASTRGKAPVAPDRRSFLNINSTQVRAHMSAWYDGGCEIDKFSIQYRQRGQPEWTLVSGNILREQNSVLIRDLTPATSYELLVGAQNRVGQTEAKYRFSTLDADGKLVPATSHSFLGANLPSLDDEDLVVDDSDEPGGPRGGGDSGPAQIYYSTGAKWLLVLRQVLNSPLTLLLAFCLFLVLLALLVFHRFNSAASAFGSTSGAALGSSALKSAPMGCGSNGAAGHTDHSNRLCSLDGAATMIEGEHPHSLTNGSSLADSPARTNLINGGSGRSRAMGAMNSNYAPLDASYTNQLGSTYCAAASQVAELAGAQQQANADALNNYQPTARSQLAHCGNVDNYAAVQHQTADFYSPAATYAGLHRSATLDTAPGGPLSQQQDAERQQYLMQMLVMSPRHEQQQQQQAYACDPATLARPQQRNSAYSMTAAALTTLLRQKSPLKAHWPDSVTTFQPGANLTLDRQHQHTFQLAPDETYPMSTFPTQSRGAASGAPGEPRELSGGYGHGGDRASESHTTGSLSNSAASTSGCETAATSSVSHLGGLSDIQELQAPSPAAGEAAGLRPAVEQANDLLQLDDNSDPSFQNQTCDKWPNSQYDVPFRFKTIASVERKR